MRRLILVVLVALIAVPAIAQEQGMLVRSIDSGPPIGAIRVDRNGGWDDCSNILSPCGDYWFSYVGLTGQVFDSNLNGIDMAPEGQWFLRQFGNDGSIYMWTELDLDRCNHNYSIWMRRYTKVYSYVEDGQEWDYGYGTIMRGDVTYPDRPSLLAAQVWEYTNLDPHDWKAEMYRIDGWWEASADSQGVHYPLFLMLEVWDGGDNMTYFLTDDIKVWCVPLDYMPYHMFGPMMFNSYTGE